VVNQGRLECGGGILFRARLDGGRTLPDDGKRQPTRKEGKGGRHYSEPGPIRGQGRGRNLRREKEDLCLSPVKNPRTVGRE